MAGVLKTMLRELRTKRGWSQAELARRAKVTDAYVAQLETGKRRKPSRAVLERLAVVLDVSVAELTKGRGSPMSSGGVVFDSGFVNDEKVTPELLVWTVLREFPRGLTPGELANEFKKRNLAKGGGDVEQRLTEMLETMTAWSAQRRVKNLGLRYRAFLESE